MFVARFLPAFTMCNRLGYRKALAIPRSDIDNPRKLVLDGFSALLLAQTLG